MYLTYDEYQEYGGTLDETIFEDFEFEAECIINWYTFDRLKGEVKYPEAIKRCLYKLINLAKLKADAMQLGLQTQTSSESTSTPSLSIQSQSNDGVSISYNTISASELFNALAAKTRGSEIDQIIQRYLQGIKNSLGRKLLYRGFYPGE